MTVDLRAFRSKSPTDVEVGEELDRVVLPITYTMVAGLIGGTRDYFPGHHDPNYARAQGQPDIYLNTSFFQGFVDRVALEWMGPRWRVYRRSMQITKSVYPGDVLVGSGRVEEVGEDDGVGTVTVAVTAGTESGDCVLARIVLQRALREAGEPDR